MNNLACFIRSGLWKAASLAGIIAIVFANSEAAWAQSKAVDDGRKIQEASSKRSVEGQSTSTASAGQSRVTVPQASSSRLVVDVDSACELRVNGERVRSIPSPQTATVTVPVGQQLVECLSSTVSGARARAVVEVSAGRQLVVILAVREAEAKVGTEPLGQAKKATTGQSSRASAEQLTPQQAAIQAMKRRLKVISPLELIDELWGLEWQRSDYGVALTWREARDACGYLSGGWSLPTVEQLQSLYQQDLPRVACGSESCGVSEDFKLANWFFWSFERSGTNHAWAVDFNDGKRRSYEGIFKGGALCVRPASR